MSLGRLTEIFDGLSRYLAIAAGWPLLGLAILIGIDVILRKFFNLSVQGSDEIGGYVMAIACAFGFSYALAKRAHIRLNIMLPGLPTLFQAVLNLIAYLIMTVLAYMMVWQMLAIVIDSIWLKAVAPTPLETPLVIPQSLCAAGFAWFALHLTIYLLRMIGLAARGEIAELNQVFGVLTAAREAEEELKETKIGVR
jgi:TRAP-type C4-dicarboxylate transport system permease small subunit